MRSESRLDEQCVAFDALAKILHVRRDKVINLVARKSHPLPLPLLFRTSVENRLKLGEAYRHKLRRWVMEERRMQARGRKSVLDLQQIEKELAAAGSTDRARKKWSVDDTIESFPPGNFLG